MPVPGVRQKNADLSAGVRTLEAMAEGTRTGQGTGAAGTGRNPIQN